MDKKYFRYAEGEEFPWQYRYAHSALTADCVVFGFDGKSLYVALVTRKNNPFKGSKALPGGFVEIKESAEDAAKRELKEETGLSAELMRELPIFSDPDRPDNRERVISVPFFTLVPKFEIKGGDDAKTAEWFPVEKVQEKDSEGNYKMTLAFDHHEIIQTAVDTLSKLVRFEPVGIEAMPEAFTLNDLGALYEAILGKEINMSSFRERILSLGFLESAGKDPLEGEEEEQRHESKGPKLYRFNPEKYAKAAKKGFFLELQDI